MNSENNPLGKHRRLLNDIIGNDPFTSSAATEGPLVHLLSYSQIHQSDEQLA
jgi:hypothetical protein